MANQDFASIKWNDSKYRSQAFKDTELGTLKEVTLICAGGQCKAHRLMLSVYSEYFKQRLAKCTTTEPISLLLDVELQDLKILLKYIYTGKACVSENNLANILEAAERFQIEGFADKVQCVKEGPLSTKKRRLGDEDRPTKKIRLESEDLTHTGYIASDVTQDDLQHQKVDDCFFPVLDWLMMSNLPQVQGPGPQPPIPRAFL